MKLLKSISAVFLLLLVMMPLLFAALFEAQRMVIRHEMVEAMEKPQLVTISLNAAEVRWHQKGKEIIVDGEFFDVKSVTHLNGKVVFTGLFDKQEKQLHKKVNDGFEKQMHGKSTLIAKLLLSAFIDTSLSFSLDTQLPQLTHNSLYHVSYSTHFSVILKPPPQCV